MTTRQINLKIKTIKKLFLSFCVMCGISSASQDLYANDSDFILLDVRTAEEFVENHVVGAINIDFLKSDFKEQILVLDKSKTYKLYCRSGNRSGQALKMMQSLGFENLENLGSVQQAAQKLNRKCEGTNPSC